MQASYLSRATAVVLFIILAFVAGRRALDTGSGSVASPALRALAALDHAVTRPAVVPALPTASHAAAETGAGFIHGRVTTIEGESYEGRIRFGGGEEALWGNNFNGYKAYNPWISYLPSDRPPTERHVIELFGFELASREEPLDLGRPFMVRMGDITRIEPSLREIRVTLKSGSVHVLDRFAADDLADGLRIRDETHGIVDLGEWKIRMIEFMPAPRPEAVPMPLYGTVHTGIGSFTGFIQWDREACLSTDEFAGYSEDGEVSVRFDRINSVARHSGDSARLTLRDGRELILSGSGDTGHGHRGIYVDDARFGRVLVSWDALDHAEFQTPPSLPAYDEFPAGRRLTGSVTTRSGHRLTGRLVFDLDESETTETLDAPMRGVDFTIPFGMVESIEPAWYATGAAGRAVVALHTGEELQLESKGDLGEHNAGLLVFDAGSENPQYVSWSEVGRIDFDDPGHRP